MSTARRHLCGRYTQGRFNYGSDEWPPYQPKHYTTLALIHRKGRHTDAEVIAVSQELANEGKVISGSFSNTQFSDRSQLYTKDISEIFAPGITSKNPRFILIEGAPGIGKTVLSKEIAYQWAINNLLKFKKFVFLLLLRDPKLKKICFIENLIQYMFKTTELVSNLSKFLFATEGKDLAIIFDGYDEMPEEDSNNSFVANIIKHEVLPQCDLVVTSRPTASVHLRDIADCRVEVLGFTKENRLDYIEHALEGVDDKIKALQSYLQSNPTINALCYIPLNMTILLSLFVDFMEGKTANNCMEVDSNQNLGSLPNTQTELYEKFILMTITRFLRKSKQLPGLPLWKLSNLPEPHNKIFEELCELAFDALNLDKIVFELDDIEDVCPNLTMASDSWSGLGLLKAAQFVNSVSFHFLHFSIQEYLAAYYIASMSNNDQITLLKETFWNIRYFNTWIMYVGITGGENFAWRHFVSGNWFKLSTRLFKTSKISKKLLRDKIKCLHLFQCYLEVGGNISVGKLFGGQTIDLSYQTLLLNDINALGFFLLRSNDSHWKELDLSNCNIGNAGCENLHQKFLGNNSRHIVNIEKVDFSHNQLNVQSIVLLIDVLQCWHTSEAIINEDCLKSDKSLFKLILMKFSTSVSEMPLIISAGPYLFAYKANGEDIERYLRNLYGKGLEKNKKWNWKIQKYRAYPNHTQLLYLNNCNWESESESNIYSLTLLSQIHIIGNAVPEQVIRNLVEYEYVYDLFLCDYTLPNKYLDNIASLLQWKPGGCNWLLIGCDKILGNIHRFVEGDHLSATCILQLLIGIRKVKINSTILSNVYHQFEHHFYENKQMFQDIIQIWHLKNSKIQSNICFVDNNILIANDLLSIDGVLLSHKYLRSVFISNCPNLRSSVVCNVIDKLQLLSVLYIFDCPLPVQSISTICSRCLSCKSQLKELFIHTNHLICCLTSELLCLLSNLYNTSTVLVTKDTLVGQKPTSEQIALALQLEPNIAVWKFHYCHHVSAETHYCIATTLTSSIHTASVELDVSGCNLGVCEMENFRSCLEYCYMQGTSCLRSLKFSYNKITEGAADAVVATLSHTKLEKLKFKCNSLTAGTTIKIFKELENISTLTTLSFCCNMVTEQAADGIAAVLLLNAKLEKLDLSYNYLQTRGIIKILRGMKHISTLTKFNISCNAIRTDAADDIAVILSYNTKLKEIDLSYNFLQSRGVMKIAKGIRHISTIKKLKLSGNMITNEAVNDIVSIVSSNTEMEELDLSLNYLQSNGIMKVIKGMTNFREFNISCNMFAKHTENNTLRILPSTAKVELLKSDFLFAVKNYSRIKHDKYSSIYDQMIRYLTVVHPTDNVKVKNITNICKVMEYVSSLTKLSISNISITDQIGSDIAVALSTCSILEELNFTHNTFIPTSAVQILKCVLKDANSLKKLSFCYNDFVKTTAKSVDAVYGSSYATHHHNTALVEFNLRYNNFPPSDIIEIMKELKDISTLKVFDVSNNCIPEEAGDYIASILFHNTTLEELHLSCTSLHSAGIIDVMKGLKNISTLRVFDISKNGISDEAADIIASALSHHNLLEELDLSCNSLQARSIRIIINGIKEVSTLKRFNVSNINVTDQVADIIASVLSHNFLLEELDLSNNKLQAIGTRVIMNGIKNISTLKKFNVSNNHITDEAADDIAQILSHNTDLKELDLSCNGLQAPGSIKIIKAMKNSSRLVQFNISHNNITEDAADYVAAVLSHNTKLEKLNLSLNNLQVNGAVNIFKQLNNISTLKALDISCNMITDRAADKIPVILSHNAELQELDLSYNFLQTCGTILIMKCLLKFSTLTIFNISCNQFTDEAADDIAAVVSCNTELEELDLSYNYLQSVGVIKIARGLENTFTLKKLKLSSNMITDEAASDITNVVSHNTQLEELDLSFNFLHSISTMQICRGMRNSLSLKIFNVSHNPITKSMADRIPIILPSSANLIMFDGQLLHSINRLQHISNTATTPTNSGTSFYNKAIHSIDRTMQIADFKNVFKAMEYISKLTKFCVMHVHVTGQIVNDILATLSLCSKLEELNLSYCAIQIANSVQIPKDLKGISTLKTLNISHNDITSEGTSVITNIVSCNFNLEELNLSCNSLPATGIIKIMKGLKHVLNLKRFNVSTNQVTDETACDIASVLSHNTMLEELDLSYNNLQTAGVISIMKGMESISTLKKFNISHNNITDEAAIYVAVLLNKV